MSEHNIQWGKVLGGAAIAAGAVAAFVVMEPYLEQTVVPALKELGTIIGEGIAKAWSWIGTHIIGHAAQVPSPETADAVATASKGLVGLIMDNQSTTVGTAAAAGALIALRHQYDRQLPQEMMLPQTISASTREDMRRMQNALAQAQTAGYKPLVRSL